MKSGIEIRTKDGIILSLNHYEPEGTAGKVMIIGPTPELTKEFYDPFARFMCRKGITVITFDYRGMGGSGPEVLKNYEATMQQWAVQDIDAVILYAKHNFPKQEIVYVGHCVGGEITVLAQASQYINKLVLISSALSCKKFWKLKARMRVTLMKLGVKFINWWFGYFPGKRVGYPVNFPGGVMSQYLSWCNSANGLFDSLPDSNYRKLQIPLLAYNFSDDWHSPKEAVRELLNRFVNAHITWRYVQPKDMGVSKIGNLGFFDGGMETKLWTNTLEWLVAGEQRIVTARNH